MGAGVKDSLLDVFLTKANETVELEDVEVERNLWFKIATHTGNSSHAWQLAGRQEAKK